MAAELLNGRPFLGTPAPQMTLAQPLNDTQMIVLAASHMSDLSPAEAVARAIDLTVEAVLQSKTIPAKLKARREEG